MDAHRTSVTHPTARSEGLLVEQIGAEAVVFDSVRNTAHCLSPLATAVFMGADGRTRLEDLAEVAASTVGEPVSVEAVGAAVAELQELGLIDEPSGMTRRTMVGRTAMATAALSAAPLVTSVATAGAAATLPSSCPMSKCVVDLEGDNWCACINTCTPTSQHPNNPSCGDLFEGGTVGSPYYGSCECEYCPYTQSASDQGSFDPIVYNGTSYTGLAIGLLVCQEVYGEEYWLNDQGQWYNWAEPCTAEMVDPPPPGGYPKWTYGCKETTSVNDDGKKKLSGVCWGNPGDSSPDVVCDPVP